MKVRVIQPETTTELDTHVALEMSDGRNPLDGYEDARTVTRTDGTRTLVPEKLGTPQMWVHVRVGDKSASCPANTIACKDGADFHEKAVAWALSELGLTEAS